MKKVFAEKNIETPLVMEEEIKAPVRKMKTKMGKSIVLEPPRTTIDLLVKSNNSTPRRSTLQ